MQSQTVTDVKTIGTQANFEQNGPDTSFASFKTEDEKKPYGITNIFGGFFQQNATTPSPRKSIKGAVQSKKDKIPEEQKKVATIKSEEKKSTTF